LERAPTTHATRPSRTRAARRIEFLDEKSVARALALRAQRTRDASRSIAGSAREAVHEAPARKKDWHLCALTD
jgi:hypothetical protein